MQTRDRLEQIVKGWHFHEVGAGRPPVIDFDCSPDVVGEEPTSRFHVLDKLMALRSDAPEAVALVIDAHVSYLVATLGEHAALGEYLQRTQGCPARGWTADHVDDVRTAASEAVASVGVEWDENTRRNLDKLSASLDAADVGDVIRAHADRYEPVVRAWTGATASFELEVETVEVDAYWSYWLDGEGQRARLRINACAASFTDVDAYRFALHEVLGHALQYSNLSAVAGASEVAWPRQLAVHCPHQVLFEGLAQVLPLAASPDDDLVRARTRVDHFTQLVNAELHLMANAGGSAAACRERAASLVPFWGDDAVAAILRDRTLDPQLRSYLWAYPAGIDWFLAAYDAGGSLLKEVLHAGYQRPLVPRELEELWPAGPRIGGDA